MNSNFKESGWMYALAIGIVAFILAQSFFFISKAWKHGKKIGISTDTLKNTVISSLLFTIAPAMSILVTVLALSNALGIVLPWIRLTVIGNLAYETVAAENALSALGSSLSGEVTSPDQFSSVIWAMTVGSIFPLTFLPIVCKKLQKKIGNAVNKNEKTAKLGDILAAAAFIGIISAFICRALAGTTGEPFTVGNAGVMTLSVLLVSIISMILLSLICKKFNLTKLEPFAMPVSMFAGMGSAMLINVVFPSVVTIYWR